jgi:DNA mismatch endonuclease (patch repair protein)
MCADVHSKEARSYNMSKIMGKDTQPELKVRKLLWNKGYRYRLHQKDLPGKPDIVFRGKKKVIFVNGCFWHKHNCDKFQWPKSNNEFWKNKIEANVKRDRENLEDLHKLGWETLTIWECEINKMPKEELLNRLSKFLN